MNKHEVAAAALAYIRCICGWEWKNEKLVGKTDADLAIETGQVFVNHQKSKEE